MEEITNLLRLLEQVRLFPYKEDARRWSLEPSGQFSCKSYLNQLRNIPGSPPFLPQSLIWKSKVPPKVRVLAQLLVQGKVNTCDYSKDIGQHHLHYHIGVFYARIRGRVWIMVSQLALSAGGYGSFYLMRLIFVALCQKRLFLFVG